MHVLADLSAYLDQELAPAERARVSAHLEGCGRCAGQLAELRATSTLIAALPSPRPSRSLVPGVAPRWNWLRPVRSLSAMASGAFLMVFLVAAVAQSGTDLGGGPASPFERAAPAAAPAAPQAGEAATAAAELRVASPEATPAPAPAAVAVATQATQPVTPTPVSAPGAAGTSAPAAVETKAAEQDAAQRQDEDLALNSGQREQAPPPTPLIWLGLSLIAALAAGVAHWRLRGA